MIVRWIVFAACLAPTLVFASDRQPCRDPGAADAAAPPCLLAAAEEQRSRARRAAPQSGEVDVNPYGDPIWQQSGSPPEAAEPRPRVKRSQLKRAHAKKRLHAKPRARAKVKRTKSRHPRAAPVGRPLNISPTSINRR